MDVDETAIGSPASFLWDAATTYFPNPPGSHTSLKHVDFLDPFWNPSPA